MEDIKARKLIGRDNLLKREILPRLKNDKPFILVGQKGIGKTELLKWAYCNYNKNKVYISCNETRATIVKRIAKKLGITVNKKKVAELEQEVLKSHTKIAVFIDDLEEASPKHAIFLTHLGNWNVVYLAGVGHFKERVKKLLWGKQKIRVKPIDRKSRFKLGRYVAKSLGCMVAPETIANQSKGVPGRAWAIGKGEVIRDDDERVEGEEINIAPVMLVFVVGIMMTRYIAMGLGERDLYVLAGIGMACSYLLRYVIRIVSK
ncbi:AAA domain (dynein-related subfamily) [Orenia metallireducens]|uniref:AAA domain (Dynein-related subfamily) n=1 Tax=Orenia metallireducens TaxID=1413210 RepID=A0A285I0L2_9FIRM|nr:ATP-binding protein [Orenia metallireducens]SNY41427.1 AAA domain (dynein-related subfamily) [Orenia metallireducens]